MAMSLGFNLILFCALLGSQVCLTGASHTRGGLRPLRESSPINDASDDTSRVSADVYGARHTTSVDIVTNSRAVNDRQLTTAVQGQVTTLQLIDANTDKVITELEDGMVIALDAVESGMNGTTVAFNVKALVNGTDVRSVRFGLNSNKYFKTESNAPFAMCGNGGSNYYSCQSRLGLGKHTITATPRNRNGQTGRPVTMTITIIETDVTPPKLIGFKALTSTTVDVSNGDQVVTVEVTLQDAAAGVLGGSLQFGNESRVDQNYAFYFGKTLFNDEFAAAPIPSVRASNNDPVTYIVSMRIRQYERPGVYPMMLFGDDLMLNTLFYNETDLSALGLPSAITIINTKTVDVKPPELLNLTALGPLVVNSFDSTSFVEFEIVVQDDLSGIDFGWLLDFNLELYGSFGKGPTNSFRQEVYHDGPKMVGGVRHTIRFKVYGWDQLAPGEYDLIFRLFDEVRNTIRLDSTELAARGFPSVITAV